ncbi:MAG: ATP-grasp domain-containing protein [Muribaculaceae bacterium]|nr:ATP-grasp domain-containing protein [Muribaculaceae bacterium]
MNNKEIAIVLGGTVPHCELIKQLQSRGYYVLLIDYLPNPPAKQVADEHIQESTLDKEAVLRVAKDRKASLVICACVDQANITACYVMEKLNHRPPYSCEMALRITNKGEMKKTMLENDIPTSKYYYFENKDDLKGIDLCFPVMVKPADSNSANGVRKAYDIHDLSIYLEDALQISRNHRAIVEEFVEGVEISAYCYVYNHHAKLLMAAERLSVLDGENEIIKCYSSVAPARIGKKAEKDAEMIATKIAEAYQLDNTPLFFQGILRDGKISVIEFAPRVGGGSCFKTIKENTGFDVIEAAIDSWLGRTVSFDSWHYPNEVFVVNTVYGKDGIFDKITGFQKLLEDGTIVALYPIRSSGEKIDNSRASSSRICFIVVKADTLNGVVDKIRSIYNEIDVISSEGTSILRKDISIYALKDKALN